MLFASQAAMAIANARAHQDERRARADLEALIETWGLGSNGTESTVEDSI